MVWMVGTYVAKVWEELFVRGKQRIRLDVFFGFLKFKYKAAQFGARQALGYIPGLVA